MNAADSYALLVKFFPVLNAGALTALIALILKHRQATKKLAIEEEVSDRHGWGELIKTLTEQVERSTQQVERVEKRVRALQDENELLRKEIRELHAVIDGMRRENQSAQVHGQRAIVDALRALPQPSESRG